MSRCPDGDVDQIGSRIRLWPHHAPGRREIEMNKSTGKVAVVTVSKTAEVKRLFEEKKRALGGLH